MGMMNCCANACSETLFGSLKVERVHGMRFDTRRRAKREVIDEVRIQLAEAARR
jgi:hypothetical protein